MRHNSQLINFQSISFEPYTFRKYLISWFLGWIYRDFKI